MKPTEKSYFFCACRKKRTEKFFTHRTIRFSSSAWPPPRSFSLQDWDTRGIEQIHYSWSLFVVHLEWCPVLRTKFFQAASNWCTCRCSAMHLELPWPSFRYSHAVLKNCGKVIGEVIFLGQLCITEVDFFAALDGTGSIQCCLYGELCITIHPWLLSIGECEFHDIALWCLWVKLWSGTPMGQQVKLLFLSCVINPKAMQQNKSKDIYYYSTSNRTAMKAKTCPYLLLETTELQGVVHGKTQLPWSSYELLSPIQFASISAVSSLRLLQSSVVSLIYNTCWVHMKHCGVCINFWSTTSEHRQLVSLV